MARSSQLNALVAVIGGGLAVLLGPISAVGSRRLTALVGVMAAVGVLIGLTELRLEYGDALGPGGRAGCLLGGVGLAALFVGALLAGLYADGGLAAGFVIAVPLVAGAVVLSVGSAMLAVALRSRRLVSPWTAALLAFGFPASPIINAVVTPFVSLWGGVYGLAWIALGVRLRTGLGPSGSPAVTGRPTPTTPASIPAALAGAVLAVFGAAGVLQGSVLLVDRYWVIDALHVALGGVGLASGAAGGRTARGYALFAGGLLLGLAAVSVVPGPGEAVRLQGRPPLLVLHLSVGLVLFVVGVADGAVEPTDD